MLLNTTDSKIDKPMSDSSETAESAIQPVHHAWATSDTRKSNVQKILKQLEIKNIKASFVKKIEATRTEAYLFELSEENLGDIFKLNGNFGKILDMALKTSGISVVAPVPDTSQIAVIVPKKNSGMVRIEPFIEKIKSGNYRIPCVLGEDYLGNPVVIDLATCQHQLIGGATGSGKSNLIKAIIAGISLGCSPRDVKLLVIDGKGLDFCIFNGIKHLLHPVVTEMEETITTLQWLTQEMDRRVEAFKKASTYDIWAYNDKMLAKKRKWDKILPALVVIIDEVQVFASAGDKIFEKLLLKLTQKGRAIGIVMILATQRPSVDILQGSIKTNLPGRVALRLPSQIDSRVILDQNGAEFLKNKGDLLVIQTTLENGLRLQAPYLNDEFSGYTSNTIKISSKKSMNLAFSSRRFYHLFMKIFRTCKFIDNNHHG